MAIPLGKLRVAGGLTLGAATIVGIPAAMFFLNSSRDSDGVDLKDLINKFPDLLDGIPQEDLKKDNKKLYEEVLDKLPTDIKEEYKKNNDIDPTNDTEKAKGQDLTSALLNLKKLLSSNISGFPKAFYDSFLKHLKTKPKETAKNSNLVYKMMNNSKFQDTWNKVQEALEKYKDLKDKITQTETDSVVQVIGLVNERGEMSNFLDKVKTNAEEIKTDTTKTYCQPKQLIIAILMGKDGIKELSDKSTNVKTSLENAKTTIQSHGINESDITQAKNKLDALTKLKESTDSCSTTEAKPQ